MSARGCFITFEGPDGSGKSTQAGRLADRLRATGLGVLSVREPGGTDTGERIRQLVQHTPSQESLCAEAETLLFAASRAQLTRQLVLPALAAGTWVVCDRYADSTAVYQGYGRGMDLDAIRAINRMATADTEPDLTLLVDVTVETGQRRRAARHAGEAAAYDRMENQARDFHERVRAGYLAWARQFPARIRTVDGERDADAVAQEIWTMTKAQLL